MCATQSELSLLIMFTPKWKKHAKLLYKGSQKFLNYKRDLLSEDRISEIESRQSDLKASIKESDKDKTKEASKLLEKTCEQALPKYRGNNAIQENIEVIFVAIVVALGIRTYFLQPFRIPTNSMYPTLNGITGQELPQDEWPNVVSRLSQHATHGRNYFSIKTEQSCKIKVETYNTLHFFSRFRVLFSDGRVETFSGSATSIYQAGLTKILDKLVKEQFPQLWFRIYKPQPFELRGQAYSQPINLGGNKSFTAVNEVVFPANTTLAEGYSQTGDLILVDKVSYHFRKPQNGEVFVFDTRDIKEIKEKNTHYIKRLVGSPGDTLKLIEAQESKEGYPQGGVLHRNNRPVTEEGVVAVQSLEKSYNGYGLTPQMQRGVKLKSKPSTGLSEYWAMGDNSFNSGDSRKWGSVKEFNVVGPAFFSLWPFGSGHWGTIK